MASTAMKADLYNVQNEKIGTVDVPEALFHARWNASLVAQVLRAQMANRRRPWAHAKDRSEVRGGGKKPWRQKGTGRARHGSIRSPLWRGGGKAHGPTNLRDYSEKVNKKMKRRAFAAVLSRRLKDHEVRFVDAFVFPEPKTKVLAHTLKAFVPADGGKRAMPHALLIPSKEPGFSVARASRNLPNVHTLGPRSLNIADLLRYKIIIIDQQAVADMEECYAVS